MGHADSTKVRPIPTGDPTPATETNSTPTSEQDYTPTTGQVPSPATGTDMTLAPRDGETPAPVPGGTLIHAGNNPTTRLESVPPTSDSELTQLSDANTP